MKPAFRTITYIVYSPKYVPGEGRYAEADSLSAALRQCRKAGFGVGSEVERHIGKGNRRGNQYGTEYSFMAIRGKRKKWRGPWVYTGAEK